jgi:hypothetical protein
MLNTVITQTPVYNAEVAYQLRTFAQTKRYQVSEITAHAVAQDAPCRSEVEDFIRVVFKQANQADINSFMSNLVALRDANGILMAAFGWEPAKNHNLFLEQYIDMPIEQLFSERLGKKITRDEITCIGNLAVANPRNAGVLIAHVIKHSLDIGIEWCVATAHHSLQNGLIKGGRDVYALAPADPAKLPEEELQHWGTYYRHIPQIVAIRGVAKPL